MEKILDIKTKDREETLLNEIKEVCKQMTFTNTWFQMEDDNDLIEACIYQMEVLKARYRYLIRKARSENLSLSPFLQKEA